MSAISKQALVVDNSQSFPNNNAGAITPTALRNFNTNMIDSNVNQTEYNTNSGSWNVSISNLNTFTASQQPSFNALNTFTASQLTINTGINTFTQSANGRLNNLELYTASFTTSVGIYDEATFVNNVNQIAFSGNGISASFVSGKAVVGVNFTPLNDFTASTSTQLNALNNNFNSYTSSTNAQLAAIQIITSSLATTGSNSFVGNQWITGSLNVSNGVTVGGNMDVAGTITARNIVTIFETASVIYSSGSNQLGDSLLDTQILSGSTFVEGELYVNKLNVTSQFALINSFTASQLSINTGYNTFTASTNSDLTSVHQTTASLNAFTASQLLINNTLTTTASFNSFTASQNLLNPTFATTGSNLFVGNQIITGSVTISGSATTDLTVVGQIFVSSSATAATTAPKITVSGSAGSSTINRNSIITRNTTDNGGIFPSTLFTQDLATSDEIGFTVDTSVFGITGWSTGPAFYINNTALDTYPAVFGFQNKANYTDGRVTVLTPLIAQSGSVISGSLTITGSVYQNVISQSIVSTTASIDLSKANFYTVALPAAATTTFNITNLGKGQTAMIQITSNTQVTASFSSNVKQPSGFAYLPSTGSGDIDVLTLASFDGTNVLVTNVTKLV